MNINTNGVLLEELRSKHSFDLNIVDQLDKEFGDDYYDLEKNIMIFGIMVILNK